MARRIDKIRESSSDELHVQERELTEQIFRLRFQLSTGQAEALRRLRDARKDLARVKTHLRAQELNSEGANIPVEKPLDKNEAAAEKTAPAKTPAAKNLKAAKPAKAKKHEAKSKGKTKSTKKAGKA
jgi:large subunit ribosomal protein L29